MDHTPLNVSIVTISFNQALYLEEALRSVLDQDYPAIEYIVVDPGSTDGSREIIERYRDRIAKIIYDPDTGPADGLNHGFAAATGQVFAYLNADDVLLPGAVSRAAATLERDSGLAVVHGDGYFIDADGMLVRRCFSNAFSERRYALGSAIVMQQSSFWRSSWFTRMGGFNIENRTCWDGEFFFSLASQGARFRHVREYWSCFRIHGESITGSGRTNDRYALDQQRMVGGYLARFGRSLPLARAAARAMRMVEDPRIPFWRMLEWVCRSKGVPPGGIPRQGGAA